MRYVQIDTEPALWVLGAAAVAILLLHGAAHYARRVANRRTRKAIDHALNRVTPE